MNLNITAQIHREGEWFIAFCSEFPEANGQGKSREECLQSLKEAIGLLHEDRRRTLDGICQPAPNWSKCVEASRINSPS